MGSRLSHAIAAPLLLLALTAAGTAGAQPSASEKETARGLMNEGRARRDRRDMKGALESFQAADALMHVPTTGYEVARTQTALGQLVEARDTLRRVLRLPAKADEPRPFVEARTNAQALDDDLAGRIPAIRLVLQGVPAGAAATVTLDDTAIPAEAANAPLKVNPGHHVIAVRAGAATGREERAIKAVTVVLTAPAVAEGAAPPPPSEAEGERPHTMRTLAFGGFGLAVVGAAAGSITGLMSLSKTSTVKQSCVDNRCPSSVAGDLDSAKTTATISTIAFAAAGVGLAVGLVAVIIGDKDAAPTSASTARVTPWIGAGSAGIRGSF